MKSLLLTHGRVIDPSNGFDEVADVLIVGGRIKRSGMVFPGNAQRGGTVGCQGMVVCPADRLPRASARTRTVCQETSNWNCGGGRGGFASVACMPNTVPPVDTPGTVALIREKADTKDW